MPELKLNNILCIRADNMGDVIMASPAFRALKETFGSRITLLTSRAGSLVSPNIPCINETIVADLPWVRSDGCDGGALVQLAGDIKSRGFDAAVIFTVYSQSSLPAAMLAFLADIPVRVAYARENPYQLLTHWLPDPEPFQHIVHQVERDLAVAARLGAGTADDRLLLQISPEEQQSCIQKMAAVQVDTTQPFLVFHPGVSEAKREYPVAGWIEAGRQLTERYPMPILVSGSGAERQLAETVAAGIGARAVSVAGMLSLAEFAALIDQARCVVSVNTATIHIAAAMQTPVVVLYAQTNPQHTPWKSPHRILPYSVPRHLESSNIIIRHVSDQIYATHIPYPRPEEILAAVEGLLLPA
ncbi:ADP-heptose--LPS heptosyltransferase 2 [Dyadobacter sp. CECT 9623]|uniref:ADP-heptose--LPS heptosyltransferase 2 n=1 Tax=Dyadobacter linearis TaxID=2823330 RepID=A0ABN7R666_9BACT|nr:glycosyltransferase family 9 protein [Dyadobacter sp. CECT 9623]CAG5067817.1 ADP-heptose--LPS heptosyltransferase 2 [Dyadobacter sp. CECT 9623]